MSDNLGYNHLKESKKVLKCKKCGNTASFIAAYRIYGECIVNGNNEELEGINSPSDCSKSDNSWEVEIDLAYKCAECGSVDITKTKPTSISQKSNKK